MNYTYDLSLNHEYQNIFFSIFFFIFLKIFQVFSEKIFSEKKFKKLQKIVISPELKGSRASFFRQESQYIVGGLAAFTQGIRN